jgi:hypothetical protein
VVGLNKGVEVILTSRKEKSIVKHIVQSLTMVKVELYDTHKAKSKIRNEKLNCSNGSMQQKMREAGHE